MLDLVHVLCLVVVAATINAANAMKLDLLMITQNSFLETLDSSRTIVKSDYQRAQAYLNNLPSQVQLDPLRQLALSNNKEKKKSVQILSTECYEFLSDRTRRPLVIEFSRENSLELDAILLKALEHFEAHVESAKRCIADEPDTANIIGNMCAAACVKRIEWTLPKIVDDAKLDFLTAICGYKRS